jgi:hypothetical protein
MCPREINDLVYFSVNFELLLLHYNGWELTLLLLLLPHVTFGTGECFFLSCLAVSSICGSNICTHGRSQFW